MIDDGHAYQYADGKYGPSAGQEAQKKKAAKRKPAPAPSSPRILADGSYDVTKLGPSADRPAGYTGSPSDLNWGSEIWASFKYGQTNCIDHVKYLAGWAFVAIDVGVMKGAAGPLKALILYEYRGPLLSRALAFHSAGHAAWIGLVPGAAGAFVIGDSLGCQ